MYKYIYYMLVKFYQRNNILPGAEHSKAQGVVVCLVGIEFCILLALFRYLFPNIGIPSTYMIIFLVVLFLGLNWITNKCFDNLNFKELDDKWGRDQAKMKRNGILIFLFFVLHIILLAFSFYLIREI